MSNNRLVYKNQPDNQDSSLLSARGVEVRDYEVYPYFPMATLGLFARTSQQAEAETALLRLGPAALYAAPEFMNAKEEATALAAIAILKRHPELLFEKKWVKKKIKSHDNEEIEIDIFASSYQLFLGAGDIWALKQVHTDILPLIQDGEAIAKDQFKEQFPNYDKELAEGMNEEERFYDNRNKWQVVGFKKQLVTVKGLIEADPFINGEASEATKQAIDVLLNILQPEPGEGIRSGLHLPLAIPLEAYKTYVALQGRWSYFSLEVIKPVLDALSNVDQQCCREGLKDLDMMMEKGPTRRCHSSYQHPIGQPLSLRLANDKYKRGAAALVDPYDGYIFFLSSSPGLFDYYNKNGAGISRLQRAVAHGAGEVVEHLKNFGRTKAEVYGSLLCSHAHRSQHTVAPSIRARSGGA